MKNENKGIELNIIKGIAGIDFDKVSLYKYNQLATSLEHILFINYLNGVKYKNNKTSFIYIDNYYPYQLSSIIYMDYSRAKRRFNNRRIRKYEWWKQRIRIKYY